MSQNLNFQWRDVCAQMLKEQGQGLTTNQFMRDEADLFSLDEQFIAPSLTKFKEKKIKTKNKIALQQDFLLCESAPKEKSEIEYLQFLASVLDKKRKDKRIAIIGEPGSGKTTLAMHMAFFLLNRTYLPDAYLPIFIDFDFLRKGESLEHLLNAWLKNGVTRYVDLNKKIKDEFKNIFLKGQVWLFLDMSKIPVNYCQNVFESLEKQLHSWIGCGPLTLICQSNFWLAKSNKLQNKFDPYKILPFSHEKICQFIDKWFNKEVALANSLRQEIARPNRAAIRDLAKNPLCLAFLCSAWRLWEDLVFPSNAKLSEIFLTKLYAWNFNCYITNFEKRELNLALSKLAKMTSLTSRFCLKLALPFNVLNSRDKRLFELATQLGWLNEVGVATEDKTCKVYALCYSRLFQDRFPTRPAKSGFIDFFGNCYFILRG
ncbi:MAG: hypothetical protein F6J93_31315 [Oscillatoria sp. SIO1A7]|nr:hypothetical protein [Oscillatoria sp. SIO1A7]